MLVKRSYKNQVAIPKLILERAGIGPKDVYFDVKYKQGHIILTPMQLEEKIPVEFLDRFEAKALRREPQDTVSGSMDEAIKNLHRKPKK